MEESTKQRAAACASCPWIKDGDRNVCFDPDVLSDTVVESMRHGNIHPCHSAKEYMCSGYLAFAEANLRAGVHELQMVRIADRLGLFDEALVNKDLNVFASVKELLADHKRRFKGV
jgi:hypothetical protein